MTEHKKSKATSYFFPSDIVGKQKRPDTNPPQTIGATTMDKQQQNHHRRTDSSGNQRGIHYTVLAY